VFGALRYDNDDFSAYSDQGTASFGYGRQILDTEKQKLKLEGGVGYRTATVAATDEEENDVIFRGLADWLWQITPSTSLGDRFLVEAGSDNTYIQNDLALTVAINSRFALGLNYQVRNNSEVSPGVDKTDTQTSVNLIYNF
jgi:putative salt-induced outer membrane protein